MDGWMDGWMVQLSWTKVAFFLTLECKMNTVCVCALITKAASDE